MCFKRLGFDFLLFSDLKLLFFNSFANSILFSSLEVINTLTCVLRNCLAELFDLFLAIVDFLGEFSLHASLIL